MQYVRQAGSDPSFLLKALSEASGELRHCFYGASRGALLAPGDDLDDCWTLLGIAVHMRDTERGVYEQIESILTYREPEISHVDIDDIPLREDYEDADEDEVLDEFHYLRRRTSYTLWDLDSRDWERGGIHPYRGRVTLLDLTRELYQHDLEHLWQARRMLETLLSSAH
ncbi:MAG TPA: DinB family protein [Tepidiformaceae bacterium]|nr:DinB family protein [Tepidiformaceae bacterium]